MQMWGDLSSSVPTARSLFSHNPPTADTQARKAKRKAERLTNCDLVQECINRQHMERDERQVVAKCWCVSLQGPDRVSVEDREREEELHEWREGEVKKEGNGQEVREGYYLITKCVCAQGHLLSKYCVHIFKKELLSSCPYVGMIEAVFIQTVM